MSGREDRRDILYQRLEAGYVKIERGLTEGQDTADWERLWKSLLDEYEAITDELAGAIGAERQAAVLREAAAAERRAERQGVLFGGDTGRRWS